MVVEWSRPELVTCEALRVNGDGRRRYCSGIVARPVLFCLSIANGCGVLHPEGIRPLTRAVQVAVVHRRVCVMVWNVNAQRYIVFGTLGSAAGHIRQGVAVTLDNLFIIFVPC